MTTIEQIAQRMTSRPDQIVKFPEELYVELKTYLEAKGYVLILTDIWNGQMKAFAQITQKCKEQEIQKEVLLGLTRLYGNRNV